MSKRGDAEKRFQAWAAQQVVGPQPRRYDRPSAWSRRLSDAIVIVLAILFWSAVLFGLVRCVGQAMAQPAQPSVQNPFDRGVPPRRPPAPERPHQAPAGRSDADIIKRLIAESIAGYDGPCACPYQHDRAGRSCGRRSAYHRPRGAAPICFEADVTPEMLARVRRSH